MTSELRDAIASAIHLAAKPTADYCHDAADAILALPELVAALSAADELKRLKGERILSVVFGHHKGAPEPFALQRRTGHALVALGAEFPDGAVALRLANDGGWTTKSEGGAKQFADDGIEIIWLSDELDSLAEMERQLDAALKVVEAARKLPTDVLGGIAADVADAWLAAKEPERKAFYQRVIDEVREFDTAVDEYDAVVSRD